MKILLSERGLEVSHDGCDVIVSDDGYNVIRLRPAQVQDAATRLLDWAEKLRLGCWHNIEPELREAAL
jgi:hypothetical protein